MEIALTGELPKEGGKEVQESCHGSSRCLCQVEKGKGLPQDAPQKSGAGEEQAYH